MLDTFVIKDLGAGSPDGSCQRDGKHCDPVCEMKGSFAREVERGRTINQIGAARVGLSRDEQLRVDKRTQFGTRGARHDRRDASPECGQ
jgi:hypothetical protein